MNATDGKEIVEPGDTSLIRLLGLIEIVKSTLVSVVAPALASVTVKLAVSPLGTDGSPVSVKVAFGGEGGGGTPGSTVTLTASADLGNRFLEWAGCDTVAENVCTVSDDADPSKVRLSPTEPC